MHKERTMSNQQPSASHLTELLKQLDESLKNHVAQTVQDHLTNIETEFDALKQEINRLNSELKNLKESATNSASRATIGGATATRTAQANHPSGLADMKLQLIWSFVNEPRENTKIGISDTQKKNEFNEFINSIDNEIRRNSKLKPSTLHVIVAHVMALIVNNSSAYIPANFLHLIDTLSRYDSAFSTELSTDFRTILETLNQLSDSSHCKKERTVLYDFSAAYIQKKEAEAVQKAEEDRIAREAKKLQAQNSTPKPGKR